MLTGLMTDRYELTMLDSFVKSGKVNDEAVFEAFIRKLPAGRRYGVFGGLGRLLPLIEDFRFEGDILTWIRENEIVSKETYDYLSEFRFRGEVLAYMEGDLFFPYSPVLTVKGTLGECVLLETLILSVLNYDSAIATTAARMVSSAKGRPIIEMGSRRTHEESAIAAARAAYIAGFASTSNLEAGKRYNIPTTGTAAHAFTLAHDTEIEAFTEQVKAHGTNTTLLVDTYDIEQGIRNAVQVAGTSLGAIRIDSGDLVEEATKAKALLTELGAYGTRIIVTSDLDEYVMKDLAEAPINGYGVGTRLVASQPMGMVYKLVQINGRAVQKKSKDKISVGGEKLAFRLFDKQGKAVDEVFTKPGGPGRLLPSNGKPLQHLVMEKGRNKLNASPFDFRFVHQGAKDTLPVGEQKVWVGDFGPYITAHPYTED